MLSGIIRAGSEHDTALQRRQDADEVKKYDFDFDAIRPSDQGLAPLRVRRRLWCRPERLFSRRRNSPYSPALLWTTGRPGAGKLRSCFRAGILRRASATWSRSMVADTMPTSSPPSARI